MIYAQGPEDKMSVGISHSLEVCGGKLVCQVCHTFKKCSLDKAESPVHADKDEQFAAFSHFCYQFIKFLSTDSCASSP